MVCVMAITAQDMHAHHPTDANLLCATHAIDCSRTFVMTPEVFEGGSFVATAEVNATGLAAATVAPPVTVNVVHTPRVTLETNITSCTVDDGELRRCRYMLCRFWRGP